jgi:hypothetical protein
MRLGGGLSFSEPFPQKPDAREHLTLTRAARIDHKLLPDASPPSSKGEWHHRYGAAGIRVDVLAVFRQAVKKAHPAARWREDRGPAFPEVSRDPELAPAL